MKNICALFVLLLTLSSAVSAHTTLTASNPGDGEAMEQIPTILELQFSEPVRLVRADLFAVNDGSEREVDISFERTVANEKTQLVPLPDNLGHGNYRVAWSVLGADGHPVSGEFTFSAGVHQGHGGSTGHGSHQGQNHKAATHDSASHNHD